MHIGAQWCAHAVTRLRGDWPWRWWALTGVLVASAVLVAGGLVTESRAVRDPVLAAQARAAADELGHLHVVSARRRRDDYDRSAFGTPWTDAVSVADGGNGCDTRNDILARDLTDTRRAAISSCPRAVMSGEFRSPYTGRFIVFRRDRRAGAVQIDHIVPLAFAWDMGAWSAGATVRARLANDPANLVAVDAGSNQDKGDKEPARWMPPQRSFRCRYAIQFVTVTRTYGLTIDAPSRSALHRTLTEC